MLLASWVGAACLPGCGPGGPPAAKRFKVTGTVSLDGKPVDTGIIKFMDPKGAGDAGPIKNGSYSLQATPGEKRVEITAAGTSDKTVEGKDNVKESVSLIPEKYNSKSELEETVEEGANSFKFELESK